MAFEFLDTSLQQRKAQGLLRVRNCVQSSKDGIVEIAGNHYLNFASNDYLGLSQHGAVQQAFAEGLTMYGSGSGASSVVTGYSIEHKALEDDLCSVLNKEAAILFSSGFSANQAICHALFPAQKEALGHVLCDKYMHASFIQGALETNAKLLRFKHNDMQHFSHLLDTLPSNSVVATEGVFSMDGDSGLLGEITQLIDQKFTDKHQAPWLVLDEAHAFGVLGNSGFGSLDYQLGDSRYVDSNKVNVVMGTFGKALGTGGAFVAGPQNLIDYMVNLSKHYVYSTAISAAQARATRAALALVEKGDERLNLQANITKFTQLARERELPVLPSNTAIQVLIVGDPVKAMAVSHSLSKLGLWVPAIRTPTVPKHTDRLRITISALHQTKDIQSLVDALCLVLQK